MLELSLTAAFLVGLLGGGHCAGMCGGIVGAVTISLPNAKPKWPFLLAYNAGRISSYAAAGAIAGAVGASSFFLAYLLPIEKILYSLACIMLILLGLYLSGLSAVLTRIERLGQHLWRRLQPYGKRFIPVQDFGQAFSLGLIWGWLPCGLVYSVLIAAIATGHPLQGSLLMLSFGLGTLPTLLTMGLAAVKLKSWLQQAWVRKISGFAVLAFGVVGLVRLLMGALS